MEPFIFLCAFLAFLFTTAKIVKKSNPVKPLPPGPTPLPIIGNIHHLIGASPTHRILSDLAKKYGPLMRLQLGEVPTLIVSSAEVAKQVMNEHDIVFADRPLFLAASVLTYEGHDIAFSPYGDYWRQLRKICMLELLSARRVQAYRSLREEKVLDMIKSISSHSGSLVNVSEKIYSLIYTFTVRAAFGEISKFHGDEYISVVEEAMKLMGGFSLAGMYPSVKVLERITGIRREVETVHKQLDSIAGSILSEHKEKRAESGKPGNEDAIEDLVDVLLKIQESREFGASLTDTDIKAVILDMFAAGGDTSSKTIVWAISEMIKNPATLQRAQDEVREVFDGRGNAYESQLHELKYLPALIKEALRLHPIVPLLLPRESRERCEISGYEIPAKTRVVVNAWAIGREPKHWDEPEKFNPDRFLDSEVDFRGKSFFYIPFGAGRRMCPGLTFALASIQLPLAQLLYHFDWKLPQGMEPEDLDMTEVFALTMGRKHDLKLIPITHHLSYMA